MPTPLETIPPGSTAISLEHLRELVLHAQANPDAADVRDFAFLLRWRAQGRTHRAHRPFPLLSCASKDAKVRRLFESLQRIQVDWADKQNNKP